MGLHSRPEVERAHANTYPIPKNEEWRDKKKETFERAYIQHEVED